MERWKSSSRSTLRFGSRPTSRSRSSASSRRGLRTYASIRARARRGSASRRRAGAVPSSSRMTAPGSRAKGTGAGKACATSGCGPRRSAVSWRYARNRAAARLSRSCCALSAPPDRRSGAGSWDADPRRRDRAEPEGERRLMKQATTSGAATEAEQTVGEPRSPELVLVSPDLRERELRELAFPSESNGVKPRPLRLPDFVREDAEQPEEDVPLLRVAGDPVTHLALLAKPEVERRLTKQATMSRAATEAEQRLGEPLSPELVLVSPELRERALRELTTPSESDGVKPHPLAPLRLTDFVLDDAEHPDGDVSLLRATGDAVAHVAVFAVLFLLVVAGAAFALTIAPGEIEPELASRRAAPHPAPGIGTAVVQSDFSAERQPGRAQDPSRQSPGPVGLTAQGQLLWNLDALVRDTFGSRPVCLRYAGTQLSLAGCSAAAPRRTAYRLTFIGAEGSRFRLSDRSTPPALGARAPLLRLRTSYISCGTQRWLALGANLAVSCERELPSRQG